MDMLLFFIGLLLFGGSFVYLIVQLIRKSFKGKRFGIMLAAGFVLMIVGLAMPSSTTETAGDQQEQVVDEKESDVESEVVEESEPELTEEEIAAKEAEEEAQKKAEAKTEEEARLKAEQEAETKAKEESIPREHKAALAKAETYANMMHMSKAGIYEQLTSEYGEGFPAEAAQYAIDNIVWDWKENALKKAETYAETMSMSDSAIYDQLVSEYGEKFTPEEAQYAIDNLQ